MLERLATKLAVWLVKRSELSLKDWTTLITQLLINLVAIQSRDIIDTNAEGQLVVNGRLLDIEGAKQLRESAHAILSSSAWKFVREQVEFNAVVAGVHKGDTPEKVYFSKVAIWWGQQFDEVLKTLAQEQ